MSKKVITILTARVSEDQWQTLKAAYQRIVAEKMPIKPVRSFLVQNKKEPTGWQIITEWQDMETLNKMRESGGVPAGVRIFKEAGADPALSIFEIEEELT